MIRLLKFEIKKKWKFSLAVLIGYLLINLATWFKFKDTSDVIFATALFFLLAGCFVAAAFVGSINNLRIEAKKPSRDLYFSLPLSAYTKIGSKVIVSFVEVTIASIVGTVVAGHFIGLISGQGILSEIARVFNTASLEELLLAFSVQILMGLSTLLIIYLSFAIYRSFFSQVKFGGLVTVVIYLVLMYLIGQYVFPHFVVDVTSMAKAWINVGKAAVFSAFLFMATGFLFEHKASFD